MSKIIIADIKSTNELRVVSTEESKSIQGGIFWIGGRPWWLPQWGRYIPLR
jgi:hypothetical protein